MARGDIKASARSADDRIIDPPVLAASPKTRYSVNFERELRARASEYTAEARSLRLQAAQADVAAHQLRKWAACVAKDSRALRRHKAG